MEKEGWDAAKIERFKEQRRCMRCKKRTFEELIICHKCQEFQYCTVECLEADREEHNDSCSIIGFKKGRLQLFQGDEAVIVENVRNKARLLDDDGDIRAKSQLSEGDEDGDEDNTQSVQQKTSKEQTASWTPKNKKKKKKKKSKRGHGKNQSNLNCGIQNSEKSQTKNKDEKVSVNALLFGGKFGGPARCDSKVKSGISFGEGWWKQRVQPEAGRSSSCTGEKSAAKSAGLCSDIDDGLGQQKDKMAEKVQSSASSPAGASASGGASLEEAMTGLELVPYDAKKANEEMERSRQERGGSTIDRCVYCKKEGFMLKCTRCKVTKYCSKECQRCHFPQHKDICKRIERFTVALSKAENVLNLLAKLGVNSARRVSLLLRDLPNPFAHMLFGARHTILLEIIGPHPHWLRHGVYVRDLAGQTTHILFYDEMGIYHHIGAGPFGIPLPLPLSRCVRPGNFILLLNSCWHHFLDGTIGIRINDLNSVQFIFMNS